MKKVIAMISFTLPVLFLLTGCTGYLQERTAENINNDYRSQERCEKKCEDYFKKEYGNGILNGGKRIVTYQNHYNKRLKKCMIVLHTDYFSKKINMGYKEKFLLDVNYLRGYGFFHNSGTITFCDVERNTCHSEEEWIELVKPYMED